MTKKYRYIISGCVSPDESINRYYLLAPQIVTKQWNGCSSIESEAIRVDVTDLKLNKYLSDMYSTVDDDIKLKDLSPQIFIRKNDNWQFDKDLTEKWLNNQIPQNDLSKYITEEMKLHSTHRGYYTEEAYADFCKREDELQKEAEAFVKEYAEKYLSKKVLKRFNKLYMYISIAGDVSTFKKNEWEDRTKSRLDRFAALAVDRPILRLFKGV